MLRSLTLALLLGTSALSAANFFPLRTGNYWTYRIDGRAQQITIRVGLPLSANNQIYYSLTGFADTRVWARNDGDKLVMFDEEAGGERILASFEPFEGGWWNAYGRTCDTLGQTQVKRVPYEGPGGSLPEALLVRYRTLGCADTGVEAEQFVENIGLVRRTVQSIAGPQVYDLVHARVGNLTFDTAQSGRFTTAIDRVTDDSITVTLRLELNPAQSITLPFWSGQEYDVALRDENGAIAYLWSSTALFAQGSHTRTITGEWTTTVTLRAPVSGNYTVEGWLTTARDQGRFAASVPLIVGPAPAGRP